MTVAFQLPGHCQNPFTFPHFEVVFATGEDLHRELCQQEWHQPQFREWPGDKAMKLLSSPLGSMMFIKKAFSVQTSWSLNINSLKLQSIFLIPLVF
jgi:hypothetical protein